MKEVTQQYTSRDLRFKADAMLALQESAEAYLVGLFEDAYVDFINNGRVSLTFLTFFIHSYAEICVLSMRNVLLFKFAICNWHDAFVVSETLLASLSFLLLYRIHFCFLLSIVLLGI